MKPDWSLLPDGMYQSIKGYGYTEGDGLLAIIDCFSDIIQCEEIIVAENHG